ncbi:MAG: DUF4147 domain-containing protein [Pseudomonadota bacterium]
MIEQLRDRAMRAFMAGVKAADPVHALLKAVSENPFPVPRPGGQRIFIGFGKASVSMMHAALSVNEDQPFKAFAVTNYENAAEIEGVEVIAAGHPIPDENGLRASKKITRILEDATEDDRVIVLISGGGSALLPAPVEGVSLADKIAVNDILLKNNLDITQMNLVRQNLSRLKGGKLNALAAPAPVTSYILSDVIGDDLNVIASGPTASAIGTAAEAESLLQNRGLWDIIPASAKHALNAGPQQKQTPVSATNILIGSNTNSAQAMATAAGARLVSTPLEGEVNDAVKRCLSELTSADSNKPIALAWGGETTVNVTGTGKGGRNQELALRFAVAASEMGLGENWCFLSGATDGRDGPTDGAGGLVDQHTISRIQNSGTSLDKLLANNDSYAALSASGDLLEIGATGTNVADLQLLLMA